MKKQMKKDYKKKPRMERDPFPKREQKRLIKLTPAQRKKEINEKQHLAVHVASLATLKGLGRGLQGARAVTRGRNIHANPFKNKEILKQFGRKGVPSKKSPVRNLDTSKYLKKNPDVPTPLIKQKPGTQGLPNPPTDFGKYIKPRMLKNKRKSCM